jgi:YHYH protein
MMTNVVRRAHARNKYRNIIAILLALDVVSIALALSAGTGNPLDLTRLPIGDGKISSAPQRGFVYACPSPSSGIGGAEREGSWINADGTFNLTAKAIVDGRVIWPHQLGLKLEGAALNVIGNGFPDHATGTFPISSGDDAYQFDRNPNRIRTQSLNWKLPAQPSLAATSSCLPMGPIGVMLTGSVIYNALDATGRDALAHETQDACRGHPDPSGTYHYHSLSNCAQDSRGGASVLLGYALDGFGIYGPRDENGKTLTNEDLDECHGRTSWVVWQGKTVSMYHYVATNEYPYVIGCFRGTPLRLPRAAPPPR